MGRIPLHTPSICVNGTVNGNAVSQLHMADVNDRVRCYVGCRAPKCLRGELIARRTRSHHKRYYNLAPTVNVFGSEQENSLQGSDSLLPHSHHHVNNHDHDACGSDGHLVAGDGGEDAFADPPASSATDEQHQNSGESENSEEAPTRLRHCLQDIHEDDRPRFPPGYKPAPAYDFTSKSPLAVLSDLLVYIFSISSTSMRIWNLVLAAIKIFLVLIQVANAELADSLGSTDDLPPTYRKAREGLVKQSGLQVQQLRICQNGCGPLLPEDEICSCCKTPRLKHGTTPAAPVCSPTELPVDEHDLPSAADASATPGVDRPREKIFYHHSVAAWLKYLFSSPQSADALRWPWMRPLHPSDGDMFFTDIYDGSILKDYYYKEFPLGR